MSSVKSYAEKVDLKPKREASSISVPRDPIAAAAALAKAFSTDDLAKLIAILLKSRERLMNEAMIERVARAIRSKVPVGYGMTDDEAFEYARADIAAMREMNRNISGQLSGKAVTRQIRPDGAHLNVSDDAGRMRIFFKAGNFRLIESEIEYYIELIEIDGTS